MRLTIERLRTSIVILGVVLLGAILLFFTYARWRVRHFVRDLPNKLGIEIQQSTNGFTLSKSQKGHTLFTLHASKAVQYKGGGRAMLHDVSITLYGKDGARADHVYGSDFEYDPRTGVARAAGEVQIDVASLAPGVSGASRTGNSPIHMKTSGLVFNQKTGTAMTNETVEFRFAAAQGSARGASYDSDSGVLVLTDAVGFRSQLRDGPVEVHADHAQFNRSTRQLALLKDTTDYAGNHGTSEQALVRFRPDGSAEKVDAQGQVHVTGKDGRELRSASAVVALDATGAPEQAAFGGGLLFAAVSAQHHLHGNANSGVVQLGSGGTLKHIRLKDAASVVDSEEMLPGDARGAVAREVLASQLDFDFLPGPDGNPVAQHVLAQGGATVSEHIIHSSQPAQETTVKGDQLFATLRNGKTLASLRGTGNTVLVNTDVHGARQTSRGDALEVSFAAQGTVPAAKGGKRKQAQGGGPAAMPGAVERAVQRGHVEITQTEPATASGNAQQPARTTTATAEQAIYDGRAETMRLEGGTPRITDPSSELAAARLDLNRRTGDVIATGEVKTTYRQADRGSSASAKAEPLHVVADRAVFDHGKDQATFYAASGGEARLWQGGNNSVSAPQLVLSRKLQTLTALGGAEGARVKAVFAGQGGAGMPGSSKKGATGTPSVARLESGALTYSGAERKATFWGNVLAQENGTTVHADAADVYLQAAASPGNAAGSAAAASEIPSPGTPSMSGTVERILAQGHVSVEEPGRQGTGEKLVYTSHDERFVLTGTAARPPRLSDETHGTVTGAALIFNHRDGSVMVNGGASQAVTETRTPK